MKHTIQRVIFLGVTTTSGLALMGAGLAMTIQQAQDISFTSNSYRLPATNSGYVPQSICGEDQLLIDRVLMERMAKNDPGCPQSREAQDRQFHDAVKEVEKELGRRLDPSEVREFNDNISGQNYGYHELVEEGHWLFGGS